MQQLGDRYRAAREFAPRVLAALRLRANPDGEQLLEAVEVLRDLNRRGVRRVPDDAPVGFVPRSWRPYVHGADGAIDRHHWGVFERALDLGGELKRELQLLGRRALPDGLADALVGDLGIQQDLK